MKLKEIKNKDFLKNSKFEASGDIYFRKYKYSEKYFDGKKPVLFGKTIPFKKDIGIPVESENAKLYIFFSYPTLIEK